MRYTLNKICEIEPELGVIVDRAISMKRAPIRERHRAYTRAKFDAWKLIGWEARDPRLRNSKAWNYFFRKIIECLRI